MKQRFYADGRPAGRYSADGKLKINQAGQPVGYFADGTAVVKQADVEPQRVSIDPTTRKLIMQKERLAGLSDVQIGDIWGISRERVAQLIGRGAKGIRRGLMKQRVVQEFIENPRRVSSIAKDVGISSSFVLELLVEHFGELNFHTKYRKIGEEAARKRLTLWVKEHPGVVITHYNLSRTASPAFVAMVDRIKPMSDWRVEFGQPRALRGKTKHNGDGISVLDDDGGDDDNH